MPFDADSPGFHPGSSPENTPFTPTLKYPSPNATEAPLAIWSQAMTFNSSIVDLSEVGKAIYVEADHELATNIILNLKTINNLVIHFSSGTEALFEFKRNAPDFFLLDLNISGNLSGLDIARIIRSKSQVPIFFSTFIVNKTEMNKLLGISNSDYIMKPFHLNEFQLRVKKMLKSDPNVLIESNMKLKLRIVVYAPG